MADINLYNDIAMFDARYYLRENPDVAAAINEAAAQGVVITPQQHYFLYGAAEGRSPNDWFDIEFYQTQPGLAGVDANLLLAHYSLHGANELLAPNPAFAGANGRIDNALLSEYVNAPGNADVKDAIAQLTGTPVGATLTAEQASVAAFQYFSYGVNEPRAGGIADVDPSNPEPTEEPTDEPTDAPTDAPTDTPTDAPTDAPTDTPSEEPTDAPTDGPTDTPSEDPTPVDPPTSAPSEEPTDEPDEPTDTPSEEPTEDPSEEPVEPGSDLAVAVGDYNDAVEGLATAEDAVTKAEEAVATATADLADAQADAATANDGLIDAADGTTAKEIVDGLDSATEIAEQQEIVELAKDQLALDVRVAEAAASAVPAAAKAAAEALTKAEAALKSAQKDSIEAGVLFGALNEAGVAGDALTGSALADFLAANKKAIDAGEAKVVVKVAADTITATVDDKDFIVIGLDGNPTFTEEAGVFTVASLDALLQAAQDYQAVLVAENAAVQVFGKALVAAAKESLLVTGADVLKDAPAKATFELDGGKLSVVDEKGDAIQVGDPVADAVVDAAWTAVKLADGGDAGSASIVDGDFTLGDGTSFKGGALDADAAFATDGAGSLLEALAGAKADQAEFLAAVEVWEAAIKPVVDAQTALDKATADEEQAGEDLVTAQEALKAAITAVGEAAGEGMNFVPAVDGAAKATDGNDLFVFTDAALDITGFAAGDKLYVGEAEEYTLTKVEVAEGQTLAQAIRAADDVEALQIFVYQDGDNTILGVEDDVLDGTAFDLTNITLVGVTANVDDVNENGNQFIETLLG